MSSRSRLPLSAAALVVLVAVAAATTALWAVVRSIVIDESDRLLKEHTTEAGLVIASLFSGTGADLSVLVTATPPSLEDTSRFNRAAGSLLGPARTISVVEVRTGAVVVVDGVGVAPVEGTIVADDVASLARRAVTARGMVSAVIADDGARRLAFAVPAGGGLVVYETLASDLSHPYVAAGGGPFSELVGAVYASSEPDPGALVLSTAPRLPLAGHVQRQEIAVGADHWLIVVKAHKPLVGPLVPKAPWGVLAAGLVAAVLATVLVETLARRRRYALALVDTRTAELRDALEERGRLQEAEHDAREQAEAANWSKSEFLSRMSHELRTPLNAVLGFGQLLELDDLSDQQRDSVGQIIKGGRHLLALINDVLDISRIDTGTIAISPEPVPVQELIDETLTLMRPIAAATGIGVAAAQQGTYAGVYVLADRQRAKQVMLNLVSNAIKYNRSQGSVTVSCDPAESGLLRLAVADTGRGIRDEDLDRLFIPFERLGAERTEVEGTGVGLALSRRLAEAMGGTIEVHSVPGEGSTFSLVLPRAEGPADRLDGVGAVPANEPPMLSPADAGRHKVVYIEDNLPNIRLVERALARRGDVELIPAMQGRLGLALVQEHRPALVLLDLHLPDIGGAEILQRLRRDPATASVPVVVLSADATDGQVERLVAAGATAYLTKPLDVQQLLTIVGNAIDAASFSST